MNSILQPLSKAANPRGAQPLTPAVLVAPEPSQLGHESIGQEHIPGPAVFGDLRPEPEAVLRLLILGVDIAHVEPYNLGQPKTRSEGRGIAQVAPGIAGRGWVSVDGLRSGVTASCRGGIVARLEDKSNSTPTKVINAQGSQIPAPEVLR